MGAKIWKTSLNSSEVKLQMFKNSICWHPNAIYRHLKQFSLITASAGAAK